MTDDSNIDPWREWIVPEETDDARWEAKRALAAAVRRLAHATVPAEPDAAARRALAVEVNALAARVEAQPGIRNRDAYANGDIRARAIQFKDRTTGLGHANPFAGPIQLSKEGDRVVGEVTFGPAHVGAPGLVHGGLVGLVLDEVLGHVCMDLGAGVVTHTLRVRYKSPTPLDVPLRAEAWLLGRDERGRFLVRGELKAGETLCAEAEGTFVNVRGERFKKLFDQASETKAS